MAGAECDGVVRTIKQSSPGVKAYGKTTSRTTKKNVVRYSGIGPVQNGSSRLRTNSPGQKQMEGFSDGGENT